MKRILGFVVPFLLSLPVLAAEEERGAASTPVATVDVVYVAIFLILFVGTIRRVPGLFLRPGRQGKVGEAAMTRLLYAPLALPLLPAVAAAQETAFDSPEPLGTVYLVCIALFFIAVLAGFWFYYMRWDEEENKEQ